MGRLMNNSTKQESCLFTASCHIEDAEERIRRQKNHLVQMSAQGHDVAHKRQLFELLTDCLSTLRCRRTQPLNIFTDDDAHPRLDHKP